MKQALIILLSLAAIGSIYSCKEYTLDQETLDQIDSASSRLYTLLEDFEFDQSTGGLTGTWTFFRYNSSTNGVTVTATTGSMVNGGVLSFSAVQGDDCAGEFGQLDLTEEIETMLTEEEDIHIELDLISATTQALGSNSLQIRTGYTTTIIYLENLEGPTTFEFVLDNGEIVEAYANGEIATNYWISAFTSSIPRSDIVLESRACGPDLYAAAQMEIESISIFRTRD